MQVSLDLTNYSIFIKYFTVHIVSEYFDFFSMLFLF
jgi:hypothetical protein